jgi:hypothetical protein
MNDLEIDVDWAVGLGGIDRSVFNSAVLAFGVLISPSRSALFKLCKW